MISNNFTRVGCFVFALAAAGSGIDRVLWVPKIVAEVNTANAAVNDTNCMRGAWLELAQDHDSDASMRYRCGAYFWPFYRSGVSHDAFNVVASIHKSP